MLAAQTPTPAYRLDGASVATPSAGITPAAASHANAASVSVTGSSRATLRIRNIRENVVYHLLFDGDVGKLTGLQLKTHVTAICNIPAEQQLLTFNGQSVSNTTTGYSLGLKDGSVLMLDFVQRAPSLSEAAGPSVHPPISLDDTSLMAGGSATHARSGSLHARAPSAPVPIAAAQQSHMNITPSSAATSPSRRVVQISHLPPPPSSSLNRLEAEIDAIRRQEAEILTRQDELRRGRQMLQYGLGGDQRSTTYPAYAAAGVYDEVDVDVEIEEEAAKIGWEPVRSADVEETRLVQQDYVWRMEQVRFETERMDREREMRRQVQELEYQAELLDRDRIELERRTRFEKCKFDVLQRQLAEEMAIEARLSDIRPAIHY